MPATLKKVKLDGSSSASPGVGYCKTSLDTQGVIGGSHHEERRRIRGAVAMIYRWEVAQGCCVGTQFGVTLEKDSAGNPRTGREAQSS